MTTVFERIQKILIEQLGVDKESVFPSASFIDDLNADSSDLAELVTYIEEEFSTPKVRLQISDEEIERIFTLQDIIDLLKDHSIEDNE